VLAKAQFRLFLSIYIHAEEENKRPYDGIICFQEAGGVYLFLAIVMREDF